MKSDDDVSLMVETLRRFRGPGDGRGAFLGDGINKGVPIRSIDLAELLEELLALRSSNEAKSN